MGTIRRRHPPAIDAPPRIRIGTRTTTTTTTTTTNMKVIASLLVLLLSCSAVSAASVHRKLQQTPSTNPFPLDWQGASADFFDEFTDEYDVAELFNIPDTYGYNDLFTELFKVFGVLGGAGSRKPTTARSPRCPRSRGDRRALRTRT